MKGWPRLLCKRVLLHSYTGRSFSTWHIHRRRTYDAFHAAFTAWCTVPPPKKNPCEGKFFSGCASRRYCSVLASCSVSSSCEASVIRYVRVRARGSTAPRGVYSSPDESLASAGSATPYLRMNPSRDKWRYAQYRRSSASASAIGRSGAGLPAV